MSPIDRFRYLGLLNEFPTLFDSELSREKEWQARLDKSLLPPE